MHVTVTKQKCFNFLSTSIENLYNTQEEFDITEFSLKTLEILMHLERSQYLKELKSTDRRMIYTTNGIEMLK